MNPVPKIKHLLFITVTIITIAATGCQSKPPSELARDAYASGDWSRAEREARRDLDPKDDESSILLARALARQKKDVEALPLFLARGGEALQAEDLLLLGRGLVREGRLALGIAAIDAASKLEPMRKDVAAALAELSGKGEADNWQAGITDQLTAVPDGHALAELIVGLLKIEKGFRNRFDPILDKVRHLKRSELTRMTRGDASRKLIARFLLQDGRPAEAGDWLAKGGDTSDPETNWLLSRVSLLLGDEEKATASLEKAGRFGNVIAHEPSRYTGAKACAECHGTLYRAQQSSRHGSTIAFGPSLETVRMPERVIVDPADPKVMHTLKREGSKVEAETRVGGQTYKAIVDYALGSGHHGLTFLGKEGADGHRELRLSYYTGGDYWGITDGFNPHPSEPDQFLGQVISNEGFLTCLNCHSTRFHSEFDRDGPEALDKGIGCEKCHGPGENHLKSVETGFPQLAIARPKIATPAQRLSLCADCHSADGSIPPTDPRFVRFQASTLTYSRCYTESRAKLDCVACHDPHRNVETSRAYYEVRCLACHGDKGGMFREDKSVRVEAVSASRCKVNPKADCLSCHMPKVVNAMKFTTFTDHHIRIHRETDAKSTAKEVHRDDTGKRR